MRGNWKKLYNYVLSILYSSPHIIGIISSIRYDMKIWEIHTKIFITILQKSNTRGVEGKIIPNFIQIDRVEGGYTKLIWFRTGATGDPLKDNKLPAFQKLLESCLTRWASINFPKKDSYSFKRDRNIAKYILRLKF